MKNTKKPTIKVNPHKLHKPALALAVVCLALWNPSARSQSAIPVHDTADSFVLNPGAGNAGTYPTAASQNFGGMNSRSVASATAHPGNNPVNPSKGEFDSVLRFDFSSTVATLNSEYGAGDWSISSLSLILNTSSTVGNTLFNTPGTGGSFNISWLSNDGGWIQGTGNPSPVSSIGITYNSLQSTLNATPATLLDTASYVASGTLVPETFSVSTANAGFLSALMSGSSISLMLTPADSQVAFNFTSRGYSGGSNPALYSPTLSLDITTVPEPATATSMIGGLALLGIRLRRNR